MLQSDTGGEQGLSTTSQFSKFQQVPERNLKSDLLSVPALGRPGWAAGRGWAAANLTLSPRSAVNGISKWLTVPIPSLRMMTIHTLSWALFAPCVDTLLCFPASLAFFPSLSSSPGRKYALYRGKACQGATLAPTTAVRWSPVRTVRTVRAPVSCSPSSHSACRHLPCWEGQRHVVVSSGGTHSFPALGGW